MLVLLLGDASLTTATTNKTSSAESHKLHTPKNASASGKTVALLPPIYRNVSIGQALVYLNSPFDLGARNMDCQCSDLDRKFLA